MARLADSVAARRYLLRHIEPDLPRLTAQAGHWHHALVIPAYREPASLLQSLAQLPTGAGRVLVILVLNRPDSDPDTQANTDLRTAAHSLPRVTAIEATGANIHSLARHADLLVMDLEATQGATPSSQGVGQARKSGCDLAFRLMCEELVVEPWIYCSDADATLPGDYFSRLAGIEAPAATFPFTHAHGEDLQCNVATELYELRLHHYVLGLRFAGSPYAFHTLGSALAVSAAAYAQVRGFPRRSGAEDFYLLNKLAKIAPLANTRGECIALASRRSNRVPFGTGPAVQTMLGNGPLAEQAIFYAPQVFAALRSLLATVTNGEEPGPENLATLLARHGLDQRTARATDRVVQGMGLRGALAHCRAQSRDSAQFARQFHQWFDGFRTLKFVHALSQQSWPRLTLAQLLQQPQPLLPLLQEQAPHELPCARTLLRAVQAQCQWHIGHQGISSG